MNSKSVDKETRINRILWIMAALVSIKTLFTDFGGDNAYTMVMSYRHLNGDRMFSEMWEPHQTSIFFTDVLLFLYHFVVPSYAGAAIYLEICGTLAFIGISIPVYRLFYKMIGKIPAQLSVIFLLIFRAKQTVFPDFANLQIGFSILLFLFLVYFMDRQEKKIYLALSALFLCLEVLSYPSTVITYLAVLLILILKSDKKLKNCLIFTGTCAVFGIAYAGYFILRLGFSGLIETCRNIVASDSHATVSTTGFDYWYGMLLAVIWILGSVFISVLLRVVLNAVFKRKYDLPTLFGSVLAAAELAMLFLQGKSGVDWTCTFYAIPLLLMCISGVLISRRPELLEEREKNIWLAGILISLGSFFATLFLTDLGIITIVAYLVLGGLVSFIPMAKAGREWKRFLILMVFIVLVHRGLVVWGYGFSGGTQMVWQVENIVRRGPTAGIVADYMTYYQSETNYDEFKKYVSDDDSLLIVEHWILDPTLFMYTDAGISNCSVIDTPVYNESLLTYFDEHPDKLPTVVAMDCWYGNMNIPEGSFIRNWVEEHYEVAGEGSYWRFYRLIE